MDKEKQIFGIAKILCGMKNGCDGCMWDKVHCNERNYAEEIYNEGYRKSEDVAREIFEEIEVILGRQHLRLLFNLPSDVTREVAELKKKYTESEDTEV